MASQFIEAEFPRTISYKALGGPAFNTTVNEGKSGFEQRNQNWQTVRGEWTVSLNTPGAENPINPQTYIDQLTAFFLVVGGKANGFRLKDHKDFTSGVGTQAFGIGDNTSSSWQLIKSYNAAGLSYVRRIVKPMTSKVVNYLGSALTDTVDIYLNAVIQSKNVGYVGGGSARYSLDETTGLVNFGSSTTKLSITGFSIINGFRAYNYTLTGPAPARNQQVIISGLGSVGANGTFIITGLGTGYILTSNPGTVANLADPGVGYTAWSTVAISAVVAATGINTYTYTLTSGQPLTVGMRVTVSGMGIAANNGTLRITSLGSGTFLAAVVGGTTETHAGLGVTDWVPAAGIGLTASYQYHFPVRFDTDKLALQLEESDVEGGNPIVSWNSITLKELRITIGASQG